VTIEEIVRLVLRLWLAGAMNIGLLLGQLGPFLLAAIGFGGWFALHRKGRLGSHDVRVDSSSAKPFTLR
jgi:hypothetical protein